MSQEFLTSNWFNQERGTESGVGLVNVTQGALGAVGRLLGSLRRGVVGRRAASPLKRENKANIPSPVSLEALVSRTTPCILILDPSIFLLSQLQLQWCFCYPKARGL